MVADKAALLAQLARAQMAALEEHVQIYHECVSGTIALTGAHPLTDQDAVALDDDLRIVRKKAFYSNTPSTLPSAFVQDLFATACNEKGVVASPKKMQAALAALKSKSPDLSTTERTQAAMVIYSSLEYWRVKAEAAPKYEERFTAICDAHDPYINMFMEWIVDGSDERKQGSVYEQELAMVLVKMISDYMPSDKRQKKKTLRRLRDFKDIPNLKTQLREVKQTIHELEDPTMQVDEILQYVRIRRITTVHGEERYRCKYVNGEVFCAMRSELECAKFIRAKCIEDHVNWRDVLVLNKS
ncbi:hypothetical protein SDRG_04348 [Saprolegnia diclina VS20]|uniref:Uncharacterized protein n=1 Tax=Saprolegnia diclina (strain VS20) TaxID=1156394 RepID=T0QVF2_SAPDV|nr:hypothetical protein SDRG_04348 [Saprolegnia diclina VS20]EQC38651.1 hypothetical protein SDRG_04348 [Saprolegnia diclina VS20]|eukprot:XP_008608243.1 hypothetical protein SDRG_04348 [Saprolegnia diclina VS20]